MDVAVPNTQRRHETAIDDDDRCLLRTLGRIAVDVGAVTLVSLGVLVYEVQQVDELVELGLVDGTGLVSRHDLRKEACPHSLGKLPCVSRSAAII